MYLSFGIADLHRHMNSTVARLFQSKVETNIFYVYCVYFRVLVVVHCSLVIELQ